MKTSFLFAWALLALPATAARAQQAAGAPAPPAPWVQLTDSAGRVIGLREDQRAGWKALHEKWDKQGDQAARGEGRARDYIKLHNAREFDLRGFLTGGQYDRWKQLNKRSIGLGERENPPGTNMPAER